MKIAQRKRPDAGPSVIEPVLSTIPALEAPGNKTCVTMPTDLELPDDTASGQAVISDGFNFKGQRYDYVDSFEYEIPAKTVLIHELRSVCPDCGASFSVTASARQIRQRSMNRRCVGCRKPGVKVRR